MTATTTTATEIVYVGDPMCSWCWGFAPTLQRLVDEHAIPLRIVVGGLRPGPSAETLGGGMRDMLRTHWEHVHEASGQPFDFAALADRPDEWLYDTELPARAVVTMRRLAPLQELAFFVRLQRAFYAGGVDITDPEVYPELLEPFAPDRSEFVDVLASPWSQEMAWNDFRWAQERRIRGFPTTLLRTGDRLRVLAVGYRPFPEVDAVLHAALERFAPYDPAAAAVCDVDGAC